MKQTGSVTFDAQSPVSPDQRRQAGEPGAADPRDPRGLRSDAPLLDGWLSFTAQARAGTLTPMSVPGHKQRQDLTGAVVAGDAPLYGGGGSIQHPHLPRAAAEGRGAAPWGAGRGRVLGAGRPARRPARSLAG